MQLHQSGKTSFLFYIFHSLESLLGILVSRAIAILCVDKATSGDRVSTDVSTIRRSSEHCRHNGVQQLSLLGERLPSFLPRSIWRENQLDPCAQLTKKGRQEWHSRCF